MTSKSHQANMESPTKKQRQDNNESHGVSLDDLENARKAFFNATDDKMYFNPEDPMDDSIFCMRFLTKGDGSVTTKIMGATEVKDTDISDTYYVLVEGIVGDDPDELKYEIKESIKAEKEGLTEGSLCFASITNIWDVMMDHITEQFEGYTMYEGDTEPWSPGHGFDEIEVEDPADLINALVESAQRRKLVDFPGIVKEIKRQIKDYHEE